ncbi:hypothetical protein B0H17DRAFT_1085525 [Mycena rosella]|uniref:F-box domain-containing protein n=1 Tax=Mycena rosella TaxID=1033263 RepID=A0AAD7CZJ0_MYCRO|nr:hypothetical protein B0H17DRAFT_1085525 [Mycena rosella]
MRIVCLGDRESLSFPGSIARCGLRVLRVKFPTLSESTLVLSMDSNLQETLNHLQVEIDALESDKTALLLRLESLDSSLFHLRAKYGTIKNRTALIGILPNEILAKIFELGRESNTPTGRQHFEVLVSHVITAWREVAITTPSLWNILEIAPSKSSRMLATYVARAKACSLIVRFDFMQEVWVPDQSVWDVILSTVDWWCSLEIFAGRNDAALYATLAHLEPVRASLLEEIAVSRGSSMHTIEISAPVPLHGFRNSPRSFQGGAPRLAKLHLEGSYLASNWPPLTHLSTLFLHELRRSTRPSWTRFRDLLTSSLQLSRLSIHGDVVSGKPPSNFEINLPQLRSLRIRGTTPLGNRVSDLLLTISAPSLDSLTLYDMISSDLQPFLSGFQLLTSLASLTLYWPNFTPNTYIQLFETMPSIQRLTLMDRRPGDFLSLLGNPFRGPSDFLCAQLKDFGLYPPTAPSGSIEDMVNNRATHAPLRLLRLGSGLSLPGVRVLLFNLSPPQWPMWSEQL